MEIEEAIEILESGTKFPDSHHTSDDLDEACKLAVTAIKTLLEERDAAIKLLRTPAWCNGCVNFKGLEGCGIGIMDECNEENDHYQFYGPQKEGKHEAD